MMETVKQFEEIPHLASGHLQPFTGENSAYLFAFRGYTIESWISAYAEMGPVFKAEVEGKEEVILAGLDVNELTWKNPDDWSYHDSVAVFREELSALHLTQLDKDEHRRKRRLLNPGFKQASIMRELPTMAEVIEAGLDTLPGQMVELHEALMKIFTRTQARTAVKVDLSEQEVDMMVDFEEGFIGALFLSKEDRALVYNRSDYLGVKQEVLAYLQKEVAARLEGKMMQDSLDSVIHQKTPAGMEPLSAAELIYDAYLMLIAGTGNTSKVLCFVLDALSRAPEWLARLEEELADYDASKLSDRGMAEFPLLKATLLEAERMFPPAPVLPRVPARDLEFLGYHLPRGTSCLHVVTAMHFSEEVYEEPQFFKPERWLDAQYPKNAHGLFGGGKHICLGMHVARLQMPLVLGHLLSRYQFCIEKRPAYQWYAQAEGPDARTVRMNIRIERKVSV